MTKNMGRIDRGFRMVTGIALLIAAFATNLGAGGWLHWAMIVVGATFAVTAAIGSCPLYAIFGICAGQR
ncbi:DUF2892 domain-containing protein [Pseudohalocynthiibacter aestuariivivens]|uniref:DUF2892 domain-containing protein n=1 Tax=Roseovarius pelagicus TaxID=2980108 RepID=A0ABY6D9N3_9RHOB|nr:MULTISPECIES: DUF2892 domain-containing protein [Rhodobacterales]QIE45243.1 DUF2892 domain-containing protein [Pseudohalocynthiibacter aestuariivivens]UXX82847.1 DUF2892 domain-containing protein [Roseovarius pelagicus]